MGWTSVKEIDQSEAYEMNREVDPQTGRCILKWTIILESGSMFWHNLEACRTAQLRPIDCSSETESRQSLVIFFPLQSVLLFELFLDLFSFRLKSQHRRPASFIEHYAFNGHANHTYHSCALCPFVTHFCVACHSPFLRMYRPLWQRHFSSCWHFNLTDRWRHVRQCFFYSEAAYNVTNEHLLLYATE